MDVATRELTVEDWRRLIQEANASDLSKREWCNQVGIPEKQLYYWQRKIRILDGLEGGEEVEAQEKSTFIELGLKEPLIAAAQMPISSEERPQESQIPSNQGITCTPTFVAEMAIQVGHIQLLIGGNISENALRTAMKVFYNA